MNGLITRARAAACVAGLFLAAATGCQSVLEHVYDPCWPERYWHVSREEERDAITPQVENGHILDQTMWNYHFLPGTANLTPGGIAHLSYVARRRPAPDPVIYLQTAHDLEYDPAAPDKLAAQRAKLDNDRIQSVQRYLSAETAGRHQSFSVLVHDPSDVSIAATPIGVATQQMNATAKGSLK